MASNPFFDKRRGVWNMKYRPQKDGPWVRVKLGDQPPGWSPSKPPKKPPAEVVDRWNHYRDLEYRVQHDMQAGAARTKGLAGYVAAYREAFRVGHDRGSCELLERKTRFFLEFAAGLGVDSVQGVTKSICRDYLVHRAGRGVAPSTLRTERGYLAPIWTRAVDDGLVAVNPWAKVPIPGKVVESKPTFWSPGQVEALAMAASKSKRLHWHADMILVLANTGIRVSAALAMRWGWIDWPNGWIAVPEDADKAGKGYRVPLTRGARDVLQRRIATSQSDLVFPNPTGPGPLGYSSFRRSFARIVRRAGVPEGTPHDLRHTFGRSLMDAGVPINVVQSALGHASLRMTQRYVSVDAEDATRHLEGFGIGDGVRTPDPVPPPSPRPSPPAIDPSR